MIETRMVTLLKTDVRRVNIQNYRMLDSDRFASQLVIDLETGHMENREQIRILLSHDQQKKLYKSLKKALNK